MDNDTDLAQIVSEKYLKNTQVLVDLGFFTANKSNREKKKKEKNTVRTLSVQPCSTAHRKGWTGMNFTGWLSSTAQSLNKTLAVYVSANHWAVLQQETSEEENQNVGLTLCIPQKRIKKNKKLLSSRNSSWTLILYVDLLVAQKSIPIFFH